MSRLRSSRGSRASASAARPAAPARRPGILVQTPKSDIFVAMLGVALGAILLACLLMLLMLWRYDFKVNAKLTARDPAVRSQMIATQTVDVGSAVWTVADESA